MDAKESRIVATTRVWSLQSVEHSGAEVLMLCVRDMQQELRNKVDLTDCDPVQVEIRLTTLVNADQVR